MQYIATTLLGNDTQLEAREENHLEIQGIGQATWLYH